MKGRALNPLLVSPAAWRRWRVHDVFRWMHRDGFIQTVTPIVTDFNSIPRILWHIMLPTDYPEAATLHDDAYQRCGDMVLMRDGQWDPIHVQWSRAECDRRYLEVLEDLGASWTKRRAMYSGVMLGGGFAWEKHRKRIANKDASEAYRKELERRMEDEKEMLRGRG